MNILEPMSISILQSESAAREHLDAILRAEGFGSPGFPRNVAQILDELLASAKKVDAILDQDRFAKRAASNQKGLADYNVPP